MTYIESDYFAPLKNSKRRIKCLLLDIARDLGREQPASKFEVKVMNSPLDEDFAEYIAIVRVGPERNFLGMRKNKRMADVRVEVYEETGYPVRATCYEESLDDILYEKLQAFSLSQGAAGTEITRKGYQI